MAEGTKPSSNRCLAYVRDFFDVSLPRSGNLIWRTVPPWGPLETETVPPACRTMPNTVERPSPVPAPRGFVVKNGSKIRRFVSSDIPVPVSRTSRTKWLAEGGLPSVVAGVS